MLRPPLARHLLALAMALLVLGACGGGGASTASAAPRDPGVATVVEVVDGDTVRVHFPGRSGSESVRLIGIDTPETLKPDSPVECFGPEASASTHELLPSGTPVRLERDVEARDGYGRLLAYVVRASDGMFVNLELVELGVAELLTFPPNTAHVAELVAAATEAERAGRGLWSACGG